MRKILAIMNDLGFEEGVGWDWLSLGYIVVISLQNCIFGLLATTIVTAKYTIEVENFDSVIHLNIFGLDYKMNFNTEDLIKENAIIDAMLKILIKAEKTRTRIYDNFVGEINDLK